MLLSVTDGRLERQAIKVSFVLLTLEISLLIFVTRRADSYHTCYTLAGLSSVQHTHYHLSELDSKPGLTPPFRWRSQPLSDLHGKSFVGVFDQEDTLQPFHP